MKTKTFASVLVALAVVAGMCTAPALAETYPSKPITLILPLGAGGSHDLNARVFTSIIPTYLGQPIVVKLMPGASGQRGTAAAAKARPDGYTLLFTHNYYDQLQQHVTKLPYDTNRDFKTVVRLNYGVASVVVRSDARWRTYQEMIAYGRSNPGKLTFGHSGQWGAVMVPGAQLLHEAGVRATLVPHKGGGPAMKALLAGDVDFTMAFKSVILAQGDRIRTLVSGGSKRSFANVPTFKELGYKSEVGRMHRIVMAPAGVPRDRMEILWAAFEKLDKDKTYNRMMKRLDENTDLMLGPEYDKLRPIQKEQYKQLVKKITGR